jgi:hypothetical protein
MYQTINLEGQKAGYEDIHKILYVYIQEPFYSAGKLLNWNLPKPVGLGFNKSIIDLLLKLKCNLVVKVISARSNYWVHYDRVKKFIDEHNCNYTVSGKTLTVLSWSIFVRLNEHE